MTFERGKDVKDALEVGLKKDALKIHKIAYIMDDTVREITNPAKMKLFLKKLSEGSLPKDPIFGIERIEIISIEKSICEEQKYESGGFGSSGRLHTEYSIIESPRTYYLSELFGKPVSIYGDLAMVPTAEELKEAGFSHLEEFEESMKDIGQEEEDQELQNELNEKIWEEQKRQREEMDNELRKMNPGLYKDEDEDEEQEEEKETKKGKRKWTLRGTKK